MIQQIFQSTHCVSEKTGFFSSLCVQWSSLVHFTLCYCMSHQWHLLISRTLVARFAALQKTVSSECNVASVRTAVQWTAGCQTQWRKVGETAAQRKPDSDVRMRKLSTSWTLLYQQVQYVAAHTDTERVTVVSVEPRRGGRRTTAHMFGRPLTFRHVGPQTVMSLFQVQSCSPEQSTPLGS